MDYDNDGTLDLISGSYDPGDVYLFRGLGEGKYAKRETIVDENDVPLVHHPAEMAQYQELEPDDHSGNAIKLLLESFGSWVAAADWDNDKDLDMLIGSFSGRLFLRENIGTREEPRFSSESAEIKANGKPIKESCHAAPVVADWDGDGVFDLVIGSGDGSVGWYRNVGTIAKPEFGERNILISPAYVRSDSEQRADENEHAKKFVLQTLSKDEIPMPGARAQICVHDYNQDGMLDLIVGDWSIIEVARELTAEEKERFEAVKKKQESLGEKLTPLQEELYSETSEELDDSEKQKLEDEYQSIVEKYMELDEERKTFFAECRSASFVWLYLRKSDGADTPSVNTETDRNALATEPEDAEDNETEASGPVSFDANLEKVGEKYQLNVEFDIQRDWHLYADAGSSGSTEVTVQLDLPDGVTTDGDWEKPRGEMSSKSPDQQHYKGSVVFSRGLNIASGSSGEINVEISYQVCTEQMCLPPTTETLSIQID